MIKKILIIMSIVTSILFVVACEKNDYQAYEGTYNLESATLDGVDIKDEYFKYTVEIKSGQEMTVFINYLNVLTNRESTYKVSKNDVIETHQKKKYVYLFDKTNQSLTQTSKLNDEILIIVLIKEEENNNQPVGVDFESILFGEKIEDTKRFNYAPAIIIEKNGKNETVMHIWYCTNHLSGIIMDHIGYRKGIQTEGGKWLFSEEKIVLAPTPNTWDSRHVCDPTVIKGSFKQGDTVYPYMMSYLGCTTDDYSNNETGLAVSLSLEGPWIKLEHLNPIVPWDRDNPSGRWGTGMPSLLSVDKQGKVLLFYSNSAVGIGVEYWDFSNLDSPERIYLSRINSAGATNPNRTALSLGIADFGYDPILKRLYVVSYTNTQNPPNVTMTRVNSHAVIAYIDGLNSMQDVVNVLESTSYTWTVLDYVGPEDTTFERNHNLGLVKDPYGIIYDSANVMVVVSTGHHSWANDNIFTYRLMGHIFSTE